MRYDELDAATRKAVDAAIGRRSSGGPRTGERQRPRPSRAGVGGGTGSFVCECGETFTKWSTADRHPAGPGHARMETLPPTSGTPTP